MKIRMSLFSVALAALALVLVCAPTYAANPSGDLRIEVLTAYNVIVDSNVESPSTYAPEAFHIGAKFCNDGTDALTDVFAYVGNYDAVAANRTPGVYPSVTNPPTGQVGTFSLTHEGGSAGAADAVRYIGAIPAGECVTQYWLVSYPRLDANGDAVWKPSIKPGDDLKLDYDVWATAADGAAELTADQTRTVTMRNEISAMANKIYPNTASKVPPEYLAALDQYNPSWASYVSNNTPGGAIVTEGTWYDLGNVGQGFDNDGDLVPDQNAWMQPIGDPALYDAGCFRLVKTEALVIVKLKSGGEQIIFAEDRLYFENIPDNTGAVGWVQYTFMVLDGPCSSTVTPYQEVASGFDNEKFNGDYGVMVGTLASEAPKVTLAKRVDPATSITPPTTLTYYMDFTNTGAAAAGRPDLGMPLVIQDTVPAGLTYVANSATTSNVLPSGVTSYKVLYSVDSGKTWSVTDPGNRLSSAPDGLVMIQWWLSHPLAASAGGTVSFQATAPTGITTPVITNVAGASFGGGAPFAEDDATTFVNGANSLGDTVWADTGAGTGGVFGDGVQNGSEPGIAGVTVKLYYDVNGNGAVDDGDIFWGTTTTDSSGVYGFSNLPDGNYVVQVDAADAQIPEGYTHTTPVEEAVALDPTGASTTGVSDLTADFGFAGALAVDKALVGTMYEGREVQYTITLRNQLPGSGKVGACEYTLWPYASSPAGTTVDWNNPQGIVDAPLGPDGDYANSVDAWGSYSLFGQDYRTLAGSGTITKVEALYRWYLSANVSDDYVGIYLYNGSTQITAKGLYQADLAAYSGAANEGTYVWDLSGVSGWSWSYFDGTNPTTIRLGVAGHKTGAADNRTLYINSIGLRITTSGTCGANPEQTLDPVPLTDTYDATRLEFVSADPPQSTHNAATGTLTWDNVGPIYPGGSKTVTLTFRVKNGVSGSVTNTASVTDAEYADGRPANDDGGDAIVTPTATGSFAGTLWNDLDGDGWIGTDGYEATDAKIAGATVELLACVSTSTDAIIYPGATNQPCGGSQNDGTWTIIATTTTDVNGGYLFTGLLNGYYISRVTSVPGLATPRADPNDHTGTCTDTGCDNQSALFTADLSFFTESGTSAGEISSANDITLVNYGYNISASLYGVLWEDNDGDGVRDPGENNLGSGLTVRLYDATCTTQIATTTTDAAGQYEFTGLTAGTQYCVKADLPSGFTNQTAESDGSVGDGIIVTAQAGVALGSYDFGFHKSGASDVGDTLYYDWDGDSAQDANEEGIPGVTVNLYEDSDNDGVIDPATDALVATTTTSATGAYLFANLPAGNYIVDVDEADPQFPASVFPSQDPDETGHCVVCNGSSTVTTDGANDDLAQDFGYQPVGVASLGDTVWKDMDGDGVQDAGETGLANITVELWVDLNNDGTYVKVSTTATGADGKYLFTDLPDAKYKVVVDANDSDLQAGVGFSNAPTTATSFDYTIANGAGSMALDFGFKPLGSIGDTVFWDANGNGTQDPGEAGIANVTIGLWQDTNNDGAYETFIGNDVTDASGKYLFSDLPAGSYKVIVDSADGDLGGAAQTSDPDRDGESCSSTTYPLMPACDHATTVKLAAGTNFMGADFGYQPQGVIGDTLWVDTDGDGQRDANELGIPYVTVNLTGPGCTPCTVETDANGNYLFSGLADGNYTVSVDTLDADWPAGLTQTYDPDATMNNQTTVTISGGSIVLTADFGYRYTGSNSLSGTVCLDGVTANGMCGSSTSGVNSDEVAYTGVTVYAYLWHDDGDGVVEAGETTQVASTQTNATGDYSFTNLPAGDGNDKYIVAMSAPLENGDLTTTDHDGIVVKDNQVAGSTVSAYQVVPIAATTTNVDFAYKSLLNYDFGDLPTTYNSAATEYATVLGGALDAARHLVPATPTLYLGAGVDYETNGLPTSTANGDDTTASDDENGVTATPSSWKVGDNGGSVQVTVAGSGWLVGWVDFNCDGDFNDAGEMIISQAASAGASTISFNIPSLPSASATLYARFRLFPEEPMLPALAYSGPASGGEVEDYAWGYNPLAVDLASFTAAVAADGVTLAWETVSETDNAGFNIYRADSSLVADDAGSSGADPLGMTGWVRLNAALIPAATPGSSQGNVYTWTDATATAAGTYWYRLEDVALDGTLTQHAPVAVTVAAPNAVGLAAFGAAATPSLAGLAALALAALAGAAARKRRR